MKHNLFFQKNCLTDYFPLKAATAREPRSAPLKTPKSPPRPNGNALLLLLKKLHFRTSYIIKTLVAFFCVILMIILIWNYILYYGCCSYLPRAATAAEPSTIPLNAPKNPRIAGPKSNPRLLLQNFVIQKIEFSKHIFCPICL